VPSAATYFMVTGTLDGTESGTTKLNVVVPLFSSSLLTSLIVSVGSVTPTTDIL
jgi:hypothetical protein